MLTIFMIFFRRHVLGHYPWNQPALYFCVNASENGKCNGGPYLSADTRRSARSPLPVKPIAVAGQSIKIRKKFYKSSDVLFRFISFLGVSSCAYLFVGGLLAPITK
jgi:hypothetical protein